MPLLPPRPGGIPPPSMLGAGPPLAGPGMMGPPPGAPPMGGPPDMGLGGPPGAMGGGPQFPSLDPATVASSLGGIRDLQLQDQQNLTQQQQALLHMLADAMTTIPNPAGQAAMTAPGYPMPPEAPQ